MVNSDIIRILYVEDDEGLAYLLKEKLEKSGKFIVETAHDGREGFAKCIEGEFDLLLVDFTMPEMNGLEVIKAVAAEKHEIPSIMLSGCGNEASAVNALKAGAYDYIMKDVEGNYMELLPSVIEKTLEQYRVIKDKNEAERALKESEEKLRGITSSMPDAVITIDSEGTITFWNKSAEKIFGYTEEEVLGQNMHDLVAPERFHEQIFKGMDKFKVTGEGDIIGQTLLLPGLKKDGTEFMGDHSFSAAKIKGKWHATAIVRDVTERLKMEEEMLKAQKLESVGVLAGGIAHDFNNILTAILGNTNLATILLTSGKVDKALETMHNIEKATIRARDLTHQLLTFSKGGEPVKKTVSLAGLIKDSSSFAIKGSNVKCEFTIPDDLWHVEVDEGQINQVINNLIINAVQAMPNGGVINISTENLLNFGKDDGDLLKKGNYVQIAIKDKGVGIKKELLSEIFDPYFTTKQCGSGLGLASSYSIIKKHGGLISVESEVGTGSIFYITIPASFKDVAKTYDISLDKLEGRGKILIMDDDEIICDMVNQTLSFIGYEIECAKNGEAAIDMYKKAYESGKPFDLVIMDLTVPGGMGGEAAIKELHRIYPEAKAIVSSGYCNNPVMSDFQKYGFHGVMSKPFEIKELNELLQKIIHTS